MSDQETTPSRPGSPIAPLPDFTSTRSYRFNWDASTRRPGPGSVATSEGRGDYITANPRLDLFNMSSTSLALGALPQEWTSTKHGFHAISTVLNNPHKRQAPPKAHAAVPPVQPSELPRVRRKDFDSYLKAVTPQWELFEKNSMLGTEGFTQVDPPVTPGSIMSFGDVPTTTRSVRLPPRTSLPPLESVPAVYFERDFNLGHPATFAAVIEQQEGGDVVILDSASTQSQPMLDKLSHYADTLELHLINEISIRSSSFFAALNNLRDLQTESQQCLNRISELRRMLKDVDERSAKRGLEVVRKETKLRNLAAVQEGVKTVGGVGEVVGVAKGLVAAGEWGEALNVVEGIQALWNTEPPVTNAPGPTPNGSKDSLKSTLPTVPESPTTEHPPPSTSRLSTIPLSSLQAFISLPDHLRNFTFEIATSLTTDLIHVLQADLVSRFDRGSSSSASSSSRGTTPAEQREALKDRLRPLLQGLRRTKGLKQALVAWRDVVMVEIRRAVKKHLPSPDDLDDDEPSTSNGQNSEHSAELRQRLCQMSQSEFMTLSRAIYSSVLGGIQGLQAQNVLLLALSVTTPSSDNNASDASSPLQSDLSDILSSAIELAHARISKVIGCRAEQHASLQFVEFLGVFSETWNFVINTETIGRRMIVGLRGVIVSQAKAFLQNFHAVRISQSAKLVEDEQWNSAEVTPAMQNVANLLVDSAVRDPPELVFSDPKTSSSASQPSSPMTNGTKSSSSKHLFIEDRKHFAVSATLQTLQLLTDYLKIIINLSLLTTDAVSRVIEFLKAFNSRTCQVVLGAGAMRSAGLKNITAKHLALASQSLSIVISLIPYVRECFRRHLNPKQAVMLTEFDKLKRDYQEHQNEIHTKLIAIMGDRLSAHCKTLQTVNWETPRDSVNDYMELLIKETTTLHKVLSRYLPEQVVEYVMSQVFAAINHRLSEEYGKFDLQSQDSKDRMLRDVRYLIQKLTGLKNVGTITSMLETIVVEKPVPRRPGGTDGAGSESANDRIMNILARSTTGNLRNTFRSSTMPIPVPVPLPPAMASPVKDKDTLMSPPVVPEKNAHNLDRARSPSPLPSPLTYPTEKVKSLLVRDKDLPTPDVNGDGEQSNSPPVVSSRPASPLAELTPTPTPGESFEEKEITTPHDLPNGDSAPIQTHGGADAVV